MSNLDDIAYSWYYKIYCQHKTVREAFEIQMKFMNQWLHDNYDNSQSIVLLGSFNTGRTFYLKSFLISFLLYQPCVNGIYNKNTRTNKKRKTQLKPKYKTDWTYLKNVGWDVLINHGWNNVFKYAQKTNLKHMVPQTKDSKRKSTDHTCIILLCVFFLINQPFCKLKNNKIK